MPKECMDNTHKQEYMDLIRDFKEGSVSLDWSSIFTHEDYQNKLNDSLTTLIYHLGLNKTLESGLKTELVGSIVIAQAQLAYALSFNNEKEFIEVGKRLEQALKKLISNDKLIKQAFEQFDMLEKIQESIESSQITQEQAMSINPVLILLELISVLNSDQEELDECCEEE